MVTTMIVVVWCFLEVLFTGPSDGVFKQVALLFGAGLGLAGTVASAMQSSPHDGVVILREILLVSVVTLAVGVNYDRVCGASGFVRPSFIRRQGAIVGMIAGFVSGLIYVGFVWRNPTDLPWQLGAVVGGAAPVFAILGTVLLDILKRKGDVEDLAHWRRLGLKYSVITYVMPVASAVVVVGFGSFGYLDV